MSEKTSETVEVAHDNIGLVAIAIGYNELAKRASTLGEKLYFRMMVDEVSKQMRALGQQPPIEDKPGVLTFTIPGGGPNIRLYDRDIELMREYIAAYDREQAEKA